MKRRFTFFFFIACLFFVPIAIYAQDVQVTGKVISKDDNQPLPGVSVIVKGTTRGTVTGPMGDFSIAAPTGAVLEFRQIGMTAATITVVNKNPITVSMVSNTAALNEVVVVGYGVQKKKVVTGAITGVKASALESQPITRVEQALQGRISGVTIGANNGQPGEGSTIRVRGLTSFSVNDPLWVVDGIVVDGGGISYLNASDIESIDVLKDAASQAIYGTRASNGVILVTTKKGKAGSIQLNYNGFYGTSAPARKLKLLNATEYAIIRNEAAAADGNPLPYANPTQYGEGTDWQEAIFNNSAKRQNHELSLSGGNERSNFYTSFGYLDQEGIVATDISKYKRINFRINSTHKVFKNFTIGQDLGYAYNKSIGLGNTNSEFGGPLASAIHLDPITPLVETDPTKAAAYNPRARLNADGFPYGISPVVGQEMTNPLAYISTRLGNHAWGHNFVGSAFAELEIIPNLKVRSTFGGKMAFWGSENFTPEFYLNSSNINTQTQFSRDNNNRVDWNVSNTITYNRSFDKHNLTLLVGQEFYQRGSGRGQSTRYDGIPATTYEQASFNYNVPLTQRTTNAYEDQYVRLASLFARFNYNYEEKYLLEAIVRRDGSTKFGANYQYGIFPSFGVGWVPTMESFWPKNDVIDFMKIRGSYGIVGNDSGIPSYYFVSTIGSGRNAAIGTDSYSVGYSPNAPANPDLRWEETKSTNIGLEATLLNNIRFSFDWYKKQTNGILQTPRIPFYVGAISPPGANMANMENSGLEFELGWNKTIRDVKIDINGNFSTLKNTVTYLQPAITFVDGNVGFQNLQYGVTRTMLGEAYNSYYGFRTQGIFQTQEEIDQYVGAKGKIQPNAKPGDFRWKDVDGDGDIDENDREVLGSSLPKYTYGLTVNVAWKGFDMVAFGQGAGGNLIFSGLRRFGITAANYQTAALGRWTGPGTSNDYPRLSESDPNYNFRNPSDFYLEDGDYFRIKTLQIGYTFPKALISKAKLSRLRIYVMSENLVTFTKYTGYDPEIGGGVFSIDRGVYPQARSFFVGVNVGL